MCSNCADSFQSSVFTVHLSQSNLVLAIHKLIIGSIVNTIQTSIFTQLHLCAL